MKWLQWIAKLVGMILVFVIAGGLALTLTGIIAFAVFSLWALTVFHLLGIPDTLLNGVLALVVTIIVTVLIIYSISRLDDDDHPLGRIIDTWYSMKRKLKGVKR